MNPEEKTCVIVYDNFGQRLKHVPFPGAEFDHYWNKGHKVSRCQNHKIAELKMQAGAQIRFYADDRLEPNEMRLVGKVVE